MNRKKAALITSIICILALVGGTIAYYTATSDITQSTVTASNLKVELVMMEDTGSGQATVSSSTPISPGETKSRIAVVKNTGKEPAWVRVKANLVVGNESYWAGETPYSQLEGIDDGTNWTADYENGYWYYKKILEPGETTPALFTGISMYTDLEDEIGGQDINLKVNAQGTQSKHNGNSALEAKGWPEK